MKKLLLSLFVIFVIIGAVKAETVTFTLTSGYDNAQAVEKLETGSVTILLSKGENSNPPAWYTSGTALRMYAKNVMTFSTSSTTEVIKSVTFTFSAKNYNFVVGNAAEPVVSAGTYLESETTGTWTGAVDSFTLTAGGTKGHARITQIVVELGSFAGVLEPTFSVVAGTFYEAQEVALDCATEGAAIHYTTNGDIPTASSTVYSSPIKIETTTTIKAMAVKDGKNSDIAEATYSIIAPAAVADIAEFKTLGKDVVVRFTNPVTVVYQNNTYMFIQDASGALQIFGAVGQTYKNGDIIPAGIMGTVGVFNDVQQLSNPIVSTFVAGTQGTAVEPLTVASNEVTVAMVNKYVKLLSVSIAPDEKANNYILTDDKGTIAAFKRFADVDIPGDDKKYDVTAIVSLFGGKVQLYPISFTESTGGVGLSEMENANNTKIAAGYNVINVESVENAQVVVVNALGQIVASKVMTSGSNSIPVMPGFYIVRVNDSVTKVIVK